MMMIIISPDQMKQIADAAETAYPNECCGLIAGKRDAQSVLHVTRLSPSPNTTQANQQDSFEVDPQIRFDLMQTLENTDEEIIGHYHSHPDHPAIPSSRDLAMVYEPNLIWMITSVYQGQAIATNAFQPKSDASGFETLEIRGTDWHELPYREPQ